MQHTHIHQKEHHTHTYILEGNKVIQGPGLGIRDHHVSKKTSAHAPSATSEICSIRPVTPVLGVRWPQHGDGVSDPPSQRTQTLTHGPGQMSWAVGFLVCHFLQVTNRYTSVGRKARSRLHHPPLFLHMVGGTVRICC